MDGWRIGYVAAPQPVIAELRKITMNSTTHPWVFAQHGALLAVTESQGCVTRMVAEDKRRRDLVVDRLNSIPGISCARPQGTIYAYPDISTLKVKADEFARNILSGAHAAVESGSFYSTRGDEYLRVCFGSEPYERVGEAMERLSNYLAKGSGQ